MLDACVILPGMSPFPYLDQFDYHHVLAETPGNSLVIFSSPGCSSCRQWKKLLGMFHEQAPSWHIFEVDAQRDMALTRELEIFHLPALFLYRDGHFHAPVQSNADLSSLRRTLESLLQAPAEELP